MDFSYSEKTEQLRAQLNNFMDDHIVPRIRPWSEEVNAGTYPVSFMEDLKALAKAEGLWNMFLPHLRDDEPGQRVGIGHDGANLINGYDAHEMMLVIGDENGAAGVIDEMPHDRHERFAGPDAEKIFSRNVGDGHPLEHVDGLPLINIYAALEKFECVD